MNLKSTRSKERIKFYLVYLIYITVLFEAVFRLFYSISYNNTKILWRPFTAISHYAPGLIDELESNVEANDESFDILLLGGSVLTEQWGNIPTELNQLLKDSLTGPFMIHNMANPARTSRDSWQNYQLLENKPYDLVVLYHGINEVRFNHCPPEVFKDDYSHVDYYAKVNKLMNSSFFHYSILPLVYYQFEVNILRKLFKDNYLPFHAPTKTEKSDWLQYGSDVKTASVFYSNYDQLISKALDSDQQLITPQFIYYIPDDYSEEAFENKELDYGLHSNPVELWGNVQTVSKGIDAHNSEIKRLANEFKDNPNYQYLVFNSRIPKNRKNFDDLCHLTDNGSKLYVETLWPSIKKAYANSFKKKVEK